MIEKYHPQFRDDLLFIASRLGRKRFKEFLIQLDRAIVQVIRNPYKAARLKYPPLTGFRKKKFFSVARPRKRQRPDLRLIYRYIPEKKTIYFVAVGFRIAQKPRNPHDVYQRTKKRNLSEGFENNSSSN
ncbi:hypothetical protein H1R82_02550 [Thermoactinomyces intermedius]|jgi:hypothetical protein|uniref:Uncharacterized protein n=1 Tax=Thermoactinomyces intermedius TaxID=2024 RepID=A0A8I1AEE2_THEIN|nr:hypothetical protein [Thermoactinomyces intermedius]MBA4549190.1 hypothetical protein [Thermoactinomyces intermedius]MBA4835516.1 hypothetical protein [Thermoactinomyces intermedius]MBH8595794.1 hypothetical protein [Thermoactinomyces intermedius]